MIIFDKILVPLDRSPLAECVLPHAIALARCLDTEVLLLHVLSLPDPQDRLRAVDALDWQLRRAEAESYLQTVCTRMSEAGVACQTRVSEGDAAERIVDCAREHQAGLVVMASHGQSGLSDWNVSSVVQKVLVRAGASLMIVRAAQPDPAAQPELAEVRYQRLLAPLDTSARAECVLPLAAALARMAETHVLLVHVVQRPEMPRRTPSSREDSELADRLVERNASEANHYLATVRSQLPPARIETRLLTDAHVADALHDLVGQERIDLVLLSAHGYAGQLHRPYGSLVASFVAYGACPLLIFQDAAPEQQTWINQRPGARSDGRR